jgi:hypothetical protein
MPNWIDENGFNKLECKRCLCVFDVSKTGEIPEHECHGWICKSGSNGFEHHQVIYVKKLK